MYFVSVFFFLSFLHLPHSLTYTCTCKENLRQLLKGCNSSVTPVGARQVNNCLAHNLKQADQYFLPPTSWGSWTPHLCPFTSRQDGRLKTFSFLIILIYHSIDCYSFSLQMKPYAHQDVSLPPVEHCASDFACEYSSLFPHS